MDKYENLDPCPLFCGGHCPYCIEDYLEATGFASFEEAEEANEACCERHEEDTAKLIAIFEEERKEREEKENEQLQKEDD